MEDLVDYLAEVSSTSRTRCRSCGRARGATSCSSSTWRRTTSARSSAGRDASPARFARSCARAARVERARPARDRQVRRSHQVTSPARSTAAKHRQAVSSVAPVWTDTHAPCVLGLARLFARRPRGTRHWLERRLSRSAASAGRTASTAPSSSRTRARTPSASRLGARPAGGRRRPRRWSTRSGPAAAWSSVSIARSSAGAVLAVPRVELPPADEGELYVFQLVGARRRGGGRARRSGRCRTSLRAWRTTSSSSTRASRSRSSRIASSRSTSKAAASWWRRASPSHG